MADPVTLALLIKLLSLAAPAIQNQSAQATPPPAPKLSDAQSLSEIGEIIIRCYHPHSQFRSVQILDSAWPGGLSWNASKAIMLRINWAGAFVGNLYQTDVAVLERDGAQRLVRTLIQDDAAFVPASNKCVFDQWQAVERK